MNEPITVHAALGTDTVPVGTLWTHAGAKPAASFRYADSWLDDARAYSLEPALPLARHPYHTRPGQPLFGSMADSTPDRWGQILIQRAHAAARRNAALMPRDYLLGISDRTRIGALRYAVEDARYLAEGDEVPPLTRLGDLMRAAERVGRGEDTPTELELLLAPGSSLGGARPKASVIDVDGTLFVAKFESGQDTYPVILWEAATLAMAREAGLQVPNFRLERVGDKTVLLLERFERQGGERQGFISGMTMLDAPDAETGSYVELAEAMRQHGAGGERDLEELWRRLVFTVLVTNTDNHLRNHGFVRPAGATGWMLSPAYDINPTPRAIKPRILTLPVDQGEATASLDVVLAAAAPFGVALARAKDIVREVSKATSVWRQMARAVGLAAGDVEFMATAFEHGELELARRI